MVGKGEIAGGDQFVLFPYGELSAIFILFEIVGGKLFQFFKKRKISIWERVKGIKTKN